MKFKRFTEKAFLYLTCETAHIISLKRLEPFENGRSPSCGNVQPAIYLLPMKFSVYRTVFDVFHKNCFCAFEWRLFK